MYQPSPRAARHMLIFLLLAGQVKQAKKKKARQSHAQAQRSYKQARGRRERAIFFAQKKDALSVLANIRERTGWLDYLLAYL